MKQDITFMKKKQKEIETKGSEMERKMDEIRKVFKKTKDIGITEHKITSITGRKQTCQFRKSNH